MVSDAEFQILKVLWALGPSTVAQVRERHNADAGTTAAYTTVMTLLGRMVTRGEVVVDRSREPFVYGAARSRAAFLQERLRTFVASVFDGHADELVQHLVDADALTEADLARLRDEVARRGRTP